MVALPLHETSTNSERVSTKDRKLSMKQFSESGDFNLDVIPFKQKKKAPPERKYSFSECMMKYPDFQKLRNPLKETTGINMINIKVY